MTYPNSPDRSEVAVTMTLSAILGQALRRPAILGSMLKAAWRFRARGWWRRPPFLPLPPREYMEWRMHTAYGDAGDGPSADEVGRYLRWANRMHGTRRAEARPW